MMDYVIEFLGTFVFMSVILHTKNPLHIAATFLGLLYFSAVSGGSAGYFNPIITFVNYLNKTVTLKVFLIYLCAQVAGGLAALHFPKLK